MPVEDNLVIQEPHTLTRHNLFPELFVLQQLQEVKTDWVLDVGDVFRFLPVLQIRYIVDKCWILHVASLREEVEIVGVGETLDKLKLNLKSQLPVFITLRVVLSVVHSRNGDLRRM